MGFLFRLELQAGNNKCIRFTCMEGSILKEFGFKSGLELEKSLIDPACKQTLSAIKRENEENVKVGREESKLNVVRCLCPQSKDAGKQPAFLVSTYIR